MSTTSAPIDVDRARAETRGCEGMAHLNHAGSSLMPIPVADALIGCELVVSAASTTLGLTKTGRTGAVVDSHETVTGEFTQNTDFTIPGDQLQLSLQARLRDRLSMFDASELARVLMGDSIFSNMMVLGASWQAGYVPLTHDALMHAIDLNGQAPERNKRAFELGRWAVAFPEEAAKFTQEDVVELPKSLAEIIDFRADHLVNYQNESLAKKYRDFVAAMPEVLQDPVAKGYHKLLAYKDEYEVARLLCETRAKAEAEFDGDLKLTYHLAPPLLGGTDPVGRPKKRGFGQWFERAAPLLAKMKGLRGTALDPFGRSEERVTERRLIADYEADMQRLAAGLTDANTEVALEIASLPLSIRGFGPVKEASVAAADTKRRALWAKFDGTGPVQEAAE